jgi:hypothetical protein
MLATSVPEVEHSPPLSEPPSPGPLTTDGATMSTHDVIESQPAWLEEEDLQTVRGKVPMVYVEAVPVRVDHLGRIEKVGLLLTAQPDGSVSRAVVSGRVMYGEALRDALWRHLNKDLGPDADPSIPPGVAPFTVAEYFPDPDRSGFHDPRQHAVALGYVVPCEAVAAEMSQGHGRLVRRALAYCGQLP